jgi:hypothetical protein
MMGDTVILAHCELLILCLAITLVISSLRNTSGAGLRSIEKHVVDNIRYIRSTKYCIESRNPGEDHHEDRSSYLPRPFGEDATRWEPSRTSQLYRSEPYAYMEEFERLNKTRK